MRLKSEKQIKLKTGEIIPAREEFDVSWNPKCYGLTHLFSHFLGREIKIKTTHFPHYFGYSTPTQADLEDAVMDGVCLSVLGNTVEPDGVDCDGSPSWLLALGVI